MINEFCKLSLVLILGFVLWGIQERTQWDQDYGKYEAAPLIEVPPLGLNFDELVDPHYFKNATLIKNQTHLACPQDLAFAKDGTIYTGLYDGNIVTISAESNQTNIIGSFPGSGRIYGVSMTSDDSTLYYAATKGLFKVNLSTKKFEQVKLEGVKVGNLNSIAIDNENQILYITDAGPIRFEFSSKIVMLSQKAGQIIKYDIRSQKAQVLLDKIAFPNGIVFIPKTNSIIYSEFNRNIIWKYSLGDRKQTKLIENLFAFADNLKISHDTGDLLVGIVIKRDGLTEFLKDKPALRKALIYIPEKLSFAMSTKIAGGIRVHPETGKIIEYLFGAPTRSSTFSSLHEKNGKLYFASVVRPSVLIVDKNAKKEEKDEKAKGQEL